MSAVNQNNPPSPIEPATMTGEKFLSPESFKKVKKS